MQRGRFSEALMLTQLYTMFSMITAYATLPHLYAASEMLPSSLWDWEEGAAGFPLGHTVAICVLLWHALFYLLYCVAPNNNPLELYRIWRFVSLLSIIQVVPDWFLDSVLGTLTFPEDGTPRFGDLWALILPPDSRISVLTRCPVKLYMAGMWAIPLMLVVWIARSRVTAKERLQRGNDLPYFTEMLIGAVVSLLVIGGSERLTLPLQLWESTARVRVKWLSIAVYVLPAEMLLGAATVTAYSLTRAGDSWKDFWKRVVAAASVTLLYTGALSISWLLIETQI